MPPKKPPVKKGNKPYARPDPINYGEVITDISKKQWKIGKSIGVGGFGEIYLASDDIAKGVTDKANYVVKIEPHANGPLFVEIAFYLRVAKTEMIEEWKQQHKLETLGMPNYVTSGAHEYKGQQYRFMVIPRFGQDLYKIIQSKPGNRLGIRTIEAIALQVINTLEYIHEKSFIHGDIKASNLLLGYGPTKKTASNQIYLLDYGLAAKYMTPEGNHVTYGPDARRAHNGTLEYTSRDAHIGAYSRRGDLEILGYNLLEWLFGQLPWSSKDEPVTVQRKKEAFMSSINLKKIYPVDIPGLDSVEKFLKYVASLKFEEKPDYTHCKNILKKGATMPKSLYLEDLPIIPGASASSGKGKNTKMKASKRMSAKEDSDSESDSFIVPNKIFLKETTKKRETRTTRKVKNFEWTKVLSSNPEAIIRAGSLSHNSDRDSSASESKSSPPISNPTPAMIQLIKKKRAVRVVRGKNMNWPNIIIPTKERLVRNAPKFSEEKPMSTDEPDSSISNPTPAMIQILQKKKENLSHGVKFGNKK